MSRKGEGEGKLGGGVVGGGGGVVFIGMVWKKHPWTLVHVFDIEDLHFETKDTNKHIIRANGLLNIFLSSHILRSEHFSQFNLQTSARKEWLYQEMLQLWSV